MDNHKPKFVVVWHPSQETEALNAMHEAMAQRYSRAFRHIEVEAAGKFEHDSVFVVNSQEAINAAYKWHDATYVRLLVEDHVNDNWLYAPNPELSHLAIQSVGATFAAANHIIHRNATVAYAVASGQHHARFDSGAGFCALNDIVIAAQTLRRSGFNPIIVDIDVHAGDGTQAMLFQSDIPTVSVHVGATYPADELTKDFDRFDERHTFHWPENHAYNFVLEEHAGDDALEWAADGIDAIVRQYRPDVIIFVVGADGHQGTTQQGVMPTGYCSYTYAGFDYMAERVRGWADEFAEGRILMTGAGGYQGLDHTPRIWANVALKLAELR